MPEEKVDYAVRQISPRIINKDIVIYSSSIKESINNRKIIIKGINKKVKAIANFNTSKLGYQKSSIAVITVNGNLYRADDIEWKNNELTLEFKKIKLDKKIIGLFVNEKYEESNYTKNKLYVLTDENKLYSLNGYGAKDSELGNTYEERRINYIPMQPNGFKYISISKADNTADIGTLNGNNIKAQYNNEILKIKTLFFKINSEKYINLYVVDENDNIYVTKKAISIRDINTTGYIETIENINEYYELEKYNNQKVKNIEYENGCLTIEYEDGTTEVNQKPEYTIGYFYNTEKN